MKIYFDTEFIEDGRTIDLLSIGLVREDGQTYCRDFKQSVDFFGHHVPKQTSVEHNALTDALWLADAARGKA